MTAAAATGRDELTSSPRARVWPALVWGGAAFYALVLSAESIYRHLTYQTTLDVAIYDQRLWLLSVGRDPFSTVITKPFLGDHFEPALALLTPLYWLGLGVPGILAAQALAFALTAPALYALARATGASQRAAALPAFLWLVSPAVAAANLFEFRPASFVSVLLVLSVLAGLERRHALLAATAILALGLKEDVALTYVVLGALLVTRGERRAGVALAAGASAAFVAAVVTIGSRSDQLDWQARRFAGDRGDSLLDVVRSMLRNPLDSALDLVANGLPVVLLLLLATGGLALLAPRWLLLALPTVLFNAASAHEPQHELAYQYHQLTFTSFFIAAAIGVRRLEGAGGRARKAVVGGFVGALVLALFGGAYTHRDVRSLPVDKRDAIDRALARIPADASVSAGADVIAHLSQRAEVYAFPQPYTVIDWGGSLSADELAERAEGVEWVVLGELIPVEADPDVSAAERALAERGFEVVARTETIRVLRRPDGPG